MPIAVVNCTPRMACKLSTARRADVAAATLAKRAERDQRDPVGHQITTPPFGLITCPTR